MPLAGLPSVLPSAVRVERASPRPDHLGGAAVALSPLACSVAGQRSGIRLLSNRTGSARESLLLSSPSYSRRPALGVVVFTVGPIVLAAELEPDSGAPGPRIRT